MAKRSTAYKQLLTLFLLRSGGRPADPFDLQRFVTAKAPAFASALEKLKTIANIIAASVTSGQKVLFVAEKMAALEVAKRRFDRSALGTHVSNCTARIRTNGPSARSPTGYGKSADPTAQRSVELLKHLTRCGGASPRIPLDYMQHTSRATWRRIKPLAIGSACPLRRRAIRHRSRRWLIVDACPMRYATARVGRSCR
jgi:uncharacterized protein (DUF1810 family)